MIQIEKYIEFLTHCSPKDITIICDLDGTLVHTDRANWHAYKKALIANGRDLKEFHIKGRATRNTIAESGAFDELTEETINKIIQQKQAYFADYLSDIIYEHHLIELINKLHTIGYNTILATRAEHKRAEMILKKLPTLNSSFDVILFKESYGDNQNKYDYIFRHYSLNPQKVFILENEYAERRNAIKCGMKYYTFLSKTYCIKSNPFLQSDTLAFYQTDYGHYGSSNNPTFINILKNHNCTIPDDKLSLAQKELKNTLYYDFLQIYLSTIQSSFVVCVVPRAKHENWYCDAQKLFRKSVSDVVERLYDEGIPVENGTQYIMRIIDTPTTHCGETYENGEKTYIGITNNTCEISSNIKGKSILLIDDIYTKNVNIDEDAIQSLYEKGAKKVIFYSVAKTPKT